MFRMMNGCFASGPMSPHPPFQKRIQTAEVERLPALAVRFVTEAAAKRDEEPPRRASS
jgi:hypothetical protein